MKAPRMPRLEAQRKLRKEYQALLNGKIDLDKFKTQREDIVKSSCKKPGLRVMPPYKRYRCQVSQGEPIQHVSQPS